MTCKAKPAMKPMKKAPMPMKPMMPKTDKVEKKFPDSKFPPKKK